MDRKIHKDENDERGGEKIEGHDVGALDHSGAGEDQAQDLRACPHSDDQTGAGHDTSSCQPSVLGRPLLANHNEVALTDRAPQRSKHIKEPADSRTWNAC